MSKRTKYGAILNQRIPTELEAGLKAEAKMRGEVYADFIRKSLWSVLRVCQQARQPNKEGQ